LKHRIIRPGRCEWSGRRGNQFTGTGTKRPRRPDLVCFVNGLPLGLTELKNPADQQADVWKAFDQLQTYQAEISDLLVFNEALVVSDGMNARVVESSQVIAEMIEMAKEMQEAMHRHEALGLNPDEEAFYDALADRPEVLLSMGDATLKKLASELTEKLRNSTTVDWQFRESVRARMRILIKQLLRKYKYPPEGLEAAIALVLKQAEALADEWTAH